MSPKDLSARMQQVASRNRPARRATQEPPTAAASSEVAAVVRPVRTPGVRTHRVTVDLDDNAYSFLRRVAFDWFVPASAVLRALLAELAGDPDLAERVQSRASER